MIFLGAELVDLELDELDAVGAGEDLIVLQRDQ